MTPRAVVIGFAFAAFICGVCFFNDQVVRQTTLIRCFLPISVYGGLMLLVIVVQPVLRRASRRLALSGREVAVIVALVLAACYVPGYGLMQTMTPFLMLPHHFEKTEPGWEESGAVEAVPDFMLADPEGEKGNALEGFVMGMGEGTEHIAFGDVPWDAWTGTLAFWVPVIVTLAGLSIAIGVVVHRQWSEHEKLQYPIVTFAHSVLPGPDGRPNPVLRNRFFWIGLGVTGLLHLNNYLFAWYPATAIEVPLALDFGSLRQLFPTLVRGGGWILLRPRLVFTAIAFSFFLASDVSLSLGLAPFVYCTVIGGLAGYGVAVRGAHLSQGVDGYLYAGAFFGVFLALIYSGRHYYMSALRSAFPIGRRLSGGTLSGRTPPGNEARPSVVPDSVRPAEKWAVRAGAFAFVLLVIQLAITGLDWQLAVLYVAASVMLLTVLSRVVAETGVFYIYPTFFPCALILGFLGVRATGFTTMAILFTITGVLMVNPSEALMPFVVQAQRLVALSGERLGRVAVVSLFVVIVGLAVALPMQLYWQYDRGGRAVGHGWAVNSVPRYGFNEAVRVKQKLEAQGALKEAESVSGWGRLLKVSPGGWRVFAFGTAVALVLLCTAARMRFPWWPIHPVLFLVLGTWQSKVLAPAFLIGWLAKVLVTRYGGGSAVRRARPLMIGLIAGEMLAGVVFMIVGAIYYAVTGVPPAPYNVLPI
ncbi:MAG: DUF6785 family protein [Planctomycetota bacterium]|jgi:hypothetical protein